MKLLVLAFLAAMFAGPCLAQAPNYLNDQSMFEKGWSELVERIGRDVGIAEISIRPDAIEVQARAAEGGARIDRWRVSFRRILSVNFHGVTGPRPERPSTPVANVESGFFPLASVPIDRLWPILEAAKARVRLDDPAHVAAVRIARLITILPNPAFGDVRWNITVASARESASVTTAPDGRVMGVDISGTNRGRNRNFLEQDDWPLADAQASFRSIIGAKREAYEIDISRSTIKMVAVSQASPKSVTAWLWDGGAFRRDFIDSPNVELIRNNGNLPFALDEIDLSKAPAILKAARDKEPSGHPRIMIAKAVKERVAVGTPRVLWEVQMVDSRRQIPLIGEDFSERTIVKLTPDAEVVSVFLPRSLRPKFDLLDAGALLAALDKLRSAYGGDVKVLDLRFRDSRAHLVMLAPGTTNATFEVELVEKGLEETSPRSMQMLNLKSAFTLKDLARLNKGTLEGMLAKAQAAVPLPGSKVHSIRFWSGEPFWRPRPGMPYVDVRVGVPPRHDVGGYVVFTADGKFIETVK
jgi:hypothetical protein